MKQIVMTFFAMLAVASFYSKSYAAVNSEELSSYSLKEMLTSQSESVKTIYAENSGSLLWFSNRGQLTSRAKIVVKKMNLAYEHGLNPTDYVDEHLLRLLANTGLEGSSRTKLDIALTERLYRYTRDMLEGKTPKSVFEEGMETKLAKEPLDAAKLTLNIARANNGVKTLTLLAPQHPHYLTLQNALSYYNSIKDRGGWPKIPVGNVKQQNNHQKYASILLERLAITGDYRPVNGIEENADFDKEVALAVKSFQQRHGLKVDGIVGGRTLEALNRPVEEIITLIELNLDRWRHLPRNLGEEYFLVNIPQYKLNVFKNSRPALEMNVVVGTEENQTPVFSDSLAYMEFSPYWNVPRSIAVNEILPKVQSDPWYLHDNNYELLADETPVDYWNIDWSQYDEDHFPFRIRQLPGEENSLGLMKFIFPNQYAVYMHDTPADHLFAERERAFSHGCVRLEQPRKLASYLIDNATNVSSLNMNEVTRLSEPLKIDLNRTIPVYITYFTATVDDYGLAFFPDIYNRDKKVLTAMKARSRVTLALHDKVEK